jgi:DNA repair protein RecO (recombination protein O)
MGISEPREGGAVSVASGRGREIQQPCYLLHAYPWRETSLVAELFTRSHGRVAVVAKGARRAGSAMRGTLLAFQPLLATWSGKSELRLLHSVEWQGGVPLLQGVALLCGLYLNELLVKALAREDPHETLFNGYDAVVRQLAAGSSPAALLRSFERLLLAQLGYAVQLQQDTLGAAVVPERRYRYMPEQGPVSVPTGDAEDPWTVHGRTLACMIGDDYSDPLVASEAKRLLRMLIQHHLGQPQLHTRQLVQDLLQL